jgi:hypothetical protein
MSSEKQQSRERRVDRREFFEIAAKTAAAVAAVPAASLVFAGCGSGEERRAPAVPARTSPEEPAGESASPPRATAPAARVPAPTGGSSEGQLVTEVTAIASLVSALQYVNESTKPDQKCANCQLYTAGPGQRGKCQLFAQGLVKETGWCASWVARVS